MDMKKNLLIIDDELEILNTLKRVFYNDYKIYVTQSTKEAFSIMKEFTIGVIICDQQMTDMNGSDFFAIVKDTHPNTVRILITGYSELTDAIMSINDGNIFRYITKPWILSDLKNSVKEAFNKYSLVQENIIMVKALKRANLMLENTVSDKTQRLENMNEKLHKSLTSQEEFIANISHDLKTPLNVISASVQLLNLYCNSGSLDEKKNSFVKYLYSIKLNSYRLSKLINNIVDSSKIKAGFFELHLSNNNIVKIAEEIVMSVTTFTESKDLNIIFDTNAEEKVIACDPEKIERLLLNLISNAIKFSDKGDEIFVQVKDRDEHVEISVKDNGIGIEKKQLNMIFDRFKQVNESLSRNAEGTGIGLSLVKSIAELHGGSVYVESEIGKGSKFTVMLPSKKVIHENRIDDIKMKNKKESIQVELSDIR
jgi:signal transduction histidine kinase